MYSQSWDFSQWSMHTQCVDVYHSPLLKWSSIQRTKPSRYAYAMHKTIESSTLFFSFLSKSDKFDWDQEDQGLILGAFFYGYVITHVPGALLCKRYGGKLVLCCGLLLNALLTVLTPVTIQIAGKYGMVVLRVIMGLGQGTVFPALCALLASWAPEKERGRLGSLVFGGGQVNVYANLPSFPLIKDEFRLIFRLAPFLETFSPVNCCTIRRGIGFSISSVASRLFGSLCLYVPYIK